MMHREIKRSGLLLIISLSVLFVVFRSGFGLFDDSGKPTGKDTRATDPQLLNAIGPGLSGVSYSSYAYNRPDIIFKVKSVSLRNRHFEGRILNFCKDIVISDLHVKVGSRQLENIMDWAYNSHLDSITSALLFDHRLLIYNEISNINIRLVVQPLRVDLIPQNSELPGFSILADSMFKESVSDDLTFKGNLRLFLNNRNLIDSPLAKWDSDRRRFLFPDGFVIHNQFFPNSPAVERKAYLSIEEIKSLLTENKHIQAFTTGRAIADKVNNKQKNGNAFPVSFDFKQIRKHLNKLDKKTQKMVVLELLATNPGVLKQAGISPSLLLFSNFKLGAFEPGPFFAGMKM